MLFHETEQSCAADSGDVQCESRLGYDLPRLKIFVVLLILSKQMLEYYLKLGRDRFLPQSSQISTDCHPVIRCYIVRITDSH
jgi:hypothetical protein